VFFLAVVVMALIAVGFVCSTIRIDEFWRDREPMPVPIPRVRPPFRYSASQCITCGTDGDLLSIDTGQCLVCFELRRDEVASNARQAHA
jgi:hypothetical protein